MEVGYIHCHNDQSVYCKALMREVYLTLHLNPPSACSFTKPWLHLPSRFLNTISRGSMNALFFIMLSKSSPACQGYNNQTLQL